MTDAPTFHVPHFLKSIPFNMHVMPEKGSAFGGNLPVYSVRYREYFQV